MLGAVLANRGFPEQAIEVWRHALQFLGSGEALVSIDGTLMPKKGWIMVRLLLNTQFIHIAFNVVFKG